MWLLSYIGRQEEAVDRAANSLGQRRKEVLFSLGMTNTVGKIFRAMAARRQGGGARQWELPGGGGGLAGSRGLGSIISKYERCRIVLFCRMPCRMPLLRGASQLDEPKVVDTLQYVCC